MVNYLPLLIRFRPLPSKLKAWTSLYFSPNCNFKKDEFKTLKQFITSGYTLAGTGSSRPSPSLPSPPPAHPILAISLLATPRVWDSHSPSLVLVGLMTTGAKVSPCKSCLGFMSFSLSKRLNLLGM